MSEFTLIEASNGAKPKVVGVAYSGGKMNLPGWRHPVVVDLAGMEIPESVPLLTNHENKTDSRIGLISAAVRNNVLEITGEWNMLHDQKIKNVYFTGMLTHGQTDFYVSYIDPESNTLRNYYPDFLVQLPDDSYVIVEVKGDNKIDDAVVQAKAAYATQMAIASGMRYKMIRGTQAVAGLML